MGIFDLFGKRQAVLPDTPFLLRAETHPYGLPANTADFVDLEITLRNNADEEAMTSVVVTVPKGIGFEQSAISQQREIRLGFLKPGEEKFIKTRVYGTKRTEKGIYSVKIFAISHYRDYGHVLNEARKILDLRVS